MVNPLPARAGAVEDAPSTSECLTDIDGPQPRRAPYLLSSICSDILIFEWDTFRQGDKRVTQCVGVESQGRLAGARKCFWRDR
jgi:hypothetical protein